MTVGHKLEHPEDELLVQLWLDRKISYEDAMRRALSKNDVRLAIKLLNKWEPDADYGEPPAPTEQPRGPKGPPSNLAAGAQFDDEPKERGRDP